MSNRIDSRAGFAMPMVDNIAQQQNAFLTAQSGLDKFLSDRS